MTDLPGFSDLLASGHSAHLAADELRGECGNLGWIPATAARRA